MIANMKLTGKRQAFNKGQAMVLVIIILLFFLVMAELIVFQLRNESIWTVKEKKEVLAFNVTDSGQERAYWKITETTDGWDKLIIDAAFPSGFDGNTVYTVEGRGRYKIHLSTGKSGDDDIVVVRTAGEDIDSRQARGIKVIYKRSGLPQSAINVRGGLGVTGNVRIHWGCIVSKSGDINLTGNANKWWPRKFAGLGYLVSPRDASATDTPHIGPDKPRNDNPDILLEDEYKEWSSNGYREAETVEVGLSTYAARAQTYGPPPGITTNGAGTCTGAYFEGYTTVSFPNNYLDTRSTACYYIKDADVSFPANASITALDNDAGAVSDIVFIVENGDLDLPQNPPAGSPGKTNYTVRVPTTCWKEYQTEASGLSPYGGLGRGDTAAINEYPGDQGYRTSGGTFDLNNVIFHGLLYVGGDLGQQGGGTKNMVGVVIVKGGVNDNGTADYWYDRTVDTKVLYSGSKFSRSYWAEFVPGSFTSPDWGK